jgi:exopolysaccharide production protein ExoQ
MKSIREFYLANDIQERLPWIFILAFLLVLVSRHDFYYSLRENFNTSPEEFVKDASHTRITSIIFYLFFGLLSVITIIRNGFKKPFSRNPLKLLLISYMVWVCLSISWSSDPLLTFKKITQFIVIVLGAVAMTSRFSINLIPKFALIVNAFIVGFGILTELILGTFQPFLITYRFSGTVHPNVQGLICALMFFAIFSLLRDESCGPRARFLLKTGAVLAVTALILTKSRTSFLAVAASAFIFWLLTSTRSKKFATISLLIGLSCFFVLIFGDGFLPKLYEAVFLFREDKAMEFTGRPVMWGIALRYASESPLWGYGYNSFWTDHIKEIEKSLRMGILGSHSAYLEIVLDAGIIGLFLLVAIIFLGIKLSYADIKKSSNIGSIFIFMVSLFFIIHGFMEAFMLYSQQNFFLIWGLLALSSQGYMKPSKWDNLRPSHNHAKAV